MGGLEHRLARGHREVQEEVVVGEGCFSLFGRIFAGFVEAVL